MVRRRRGRWGPRPCRRRQRRRSTTSETLRRWHSPSNPERLAAADERILAQLPFTSRALQHAAQNRDHHAEATNPTPAIRVRSSQRCKLASAGDHPSPSGGCPRWSRSARHRYAAGELQTRPSRRPDEQRRNTQAGQRLATAPRDRRASAIHRRRPVLPRRYSPRAPNGDPVQLALMKRLARGHRQRDLQRLGRLHVVAAQHCWIALSLSIGARSTTN